MPQLTINATEFYYEIHGSGDPIVLIGGLKRDHSSWLSILEMLAKDHTVLIFDNRGAGQTVDAGQFFDVDAMAEDTLQLINLLGLKKPHIVGHSLGGAVAQVIAHKYSEYIKSVALCNTFPKLNADAKKVFTSILDNHRAGASQSDLMDMLIPWVFSDGFISPELRAVVRKSNDDNLYPQTLLGYERQLHALSTFDSQSWAHLIITPTLVIAADQDKIALPSESQELSDRIKDSQLVTLSSGHASQVEKPKEFVSALQRFYRDLAA
jgi:3-oxoadipate enol-lactonase